MSGRTMTFLLSFLPALILSISFSYVLSVSGLSTRRKYPLRLRCCSASALRCYLGPCMTIVWRIGSSVFWVYQ